MIMNFTCLSTELNQERHNPIVPFCFSFFLFFCLFLQSPSPKPTPGSIQMRTQKIQVRNNLIASSAPSVSLPPLGEHASLSSLFIPARAADGHIRACGFTLLRLQIREQAVRAGGAAATLTQAWGVKWLPFGGFSVRESGCVGVLHFGRLGWFWRCGRNG